MKIELHHNFIRKHKKLKESAKKKFQERRDLFLGSTYHPLLNNHPLRGKYKGYRSINIGGNLRVIYRHLDDETVIFTEIGSHNYLYR